ncbi:MAG: radical SAM protein [Deltaproteobacteria bacterium]|nr:radical SAM protein [Deltaproteobacteria bacterium]
MENSRDQNLLFLVAPNLTLFRELPYVEPALGSSLVTGGLKHAHIPTTYVDLNLKFNILHDKKTLLATSTLQYLQKWRHIIKTRKETLPSDLDTVLNKAVEFIGSFSYSAIAISLNRVTVFHDVFESSFGFITLLCRRLKNKSDQKIILGGQILNIIGAHNIKKALDQSQDHPYDYLFFGDGAIALPILVNTDFDTDKLTEHVKHTGELFIHGKEWTLVDGEELSNTTTDTETVLRSKLLNITPSYDIVNGSHYTTSFAKILPQTPCKNHWQEAEIAIYPYKFMYGCSHKCAFCKEANNPLIAKPAKVVVDILERYVNEKGIKNFLFLNSQINFSQKYVEEFCSEIIKRRLNIQYSDSACFRNLSKDVCSLLRESGCIKLWFGLESPIERILKLINKQLSIDEALRGIINAHDAGIWICVNIIVGFPHETDEEFNELCSFIRTYSDIVNCWGFSSLELHHNTPMFNDPDAYGIIIDHKYSREDNIYGYAFSETRGLEWKARETKALEREELLNSLVTPYKHKIMSNDYLIFALYQCLHDKPSVVMELNKYIKSLKQLMDVHDVAHWLRYKSIYGFDSSNYFNKNAALYNKHG